MCVWTHVCFLLEGSVFGWFSVLLVFFTWFHSMILHERQSSPACSSGVQMIFCFMNMKPLGSCLDSRTCRVLTDSMLKLEWPWRCFYFITTSEKVHRSSTADGWSSRIICHKWFFTRSLQDPHFLMRFYFRSVVSVCSNVCKLLMGGGGGVKPSAGIRSKRDKLHGSESHLQTAEQDLPADKDQLSSRCTPRWRIGGSCWPSCFCIQPEDLGGGGSSLLFCFLATAVALSGGGEPAGIQDKAQRAG